MCTCIIKHLSNQNTNLKEKPSEWHICTVFKHQNDSVHIWWWKIIIFHVPATPVSAIISHHAGFPNSQAMRHFSFSLGISATCYTPLTHV